MRQYTRVRVRGNLNALNVRLPAGNAAPFMPSFSGSEGHQGRASCSRIGILWHGSALPGSVALQTDIRNP